MKELGPFPFAIGSYVRVLPDELRKSGWVDEDFKKYPWVLDKLQVEMSHIGDYMAKGSSDSLYIRTPWGEYTHWFVPDCAIDFKTTRAEGLI